MLTQVRKKIFQKDIKKYSEIRVADWWNVEIGSYIFKHSTFAKQRYSKKKMKTSFENSNLAQIPYYKVNNEIYSMILLCPSGSFKKGHKDHNDNKPEKMKIEKSFLLGETEITQELYQAVMGVENSSYFKDNPRNPVGMVSWYDALIFCNKLSDVFELGRYYTIGNAQEITDDYGNTNTHYPVEMNEDSKGFRLPTEWEWEYAAKADTQLLYSGSNDLNEVGWYGNNSNTTHPVKQKKPNAWGFYDMSGNVKEWCENKYDPMEMEISADRVYRGGSRWSYGSNLHSAYRDGHSPRHRSAEIGFRVCRYI